MKEFEGRRRGILATGMVQPRWQHIAPCEKGVEWGLGTRNLRMVTAFWDGIPVDVTWKAGVVPRCSVDALPSEHPFSCLIRHAGKRWTREPIMH